MKTILIIGAGRSSSTLINYLEKKAFEYNWKIIIGDKETGHLRNRVNEVISIASFDVKDDLCREDEIKRADLVISMLPIRFYKLVAKSCLKFSKTLLTASNESPEIKAFESDIERLGLLFINEMGFDPGLDHMSAMKVINQLKSKGHELQCFESFSGGLVAPESDNNPWNYKFSWNPKNMVLDGQDGPARFRQDGLFKYIPYNRIFSQTELIEIEKYGTFEGYANHDVLKYIEKYNLQGIPSIYRGTLRRPGFCKAWNIFVRLGATDDSYFMDNIENKTYREYINSFLYYHKSDTVETKLFQYMQIEQDLDIIGKLKWLGIFDNKPIGLKKATPAQVLEHLLKQKWQLKPHDKDLIVMWHKFIYNDATTHKPVNLISSMAVTGADAENTAMANVVGLPLAIAAKLILTGEIDLIGLYIPTVKEIYEPILKELENYDIRFSETIHKTDNENRQAH